jgi:transposase-like protein
MATDKRGVSALLLQRQLGLGNYETAWMMLHKFRRAMVNANREPLRGGVEIDDTWIGGTQAGLRGSRQLKGRKAALVLVAVEKRGQASGRVRMAVIPDRATTLLAFLKEHVAPGSTVYTDGLKSYVGLKEAGYQHVARIQPTRAALRKGTKSVVPLADRAIGNLQQWLIGTYHGVSKEQLQVYLDESSFVTTGGGYPWPHFRLCSAWVRPSSRLPIGKSVAQSTFRAPETLPSAFHNLLGLAETTGQAGAN